MAEGWAPPLRLCERDNGSCRLTLVGLTHGDGDTLQDAADDLVTRLLEILSVVRVAGFPVSTEFPPPDPRLMEYVWRLGDHVWRGSDIREHVFGSIPSLDTFA